MKSKISTSKQRVSEWIEREKTKRSNYEALIAKALMSQSGKQALAQAMATPIRNALDYQSLGRKIGPGLPVYENDISNAIPNQKESKKVKKYKK